MAKEIARIVVQYKAKERNMWHIGHDEIQPTKWSAET
jgi:hypothetical protein